MPYASIPAGVLGDGKNPYCTRTRISAPRPLSNGTAPGFRPHSFVFRPPEFTGSPSCLPVRLRKLEARSNYTLATWPREKTSYVESGYPIPRPQLAVDSVHGLGGSLHYQCLSSLSYKLGLIIPAPGDAIGSDEKVYKTSGTVLSS